MIQAADIDPAPITAWVILAASIIGLGTAFAVLIGWFWKRVGIPDVRAVVRTELDAADRDHRTEHDRLDQCISTVHTELTQRIDAADKARESSIRHVHSRIDDAILGQQ